MSDLLCSVVVSLLLAAAPLQSQAQAARPGPAPSAPEGADILGPLGPLPLPAPEAGGSAKPWTRRAVAVAVAAGLVGMAGYLYVRWRRRMEAAPVVRGPWAPSLAEQVEGLDDGEFYARLLAAARRALAARVGKRVASLTPRELAEVEIPSCPAAGEGGSAQERWRGLCLRAEAAEYGRARIEPAARQADLRLVLDLIVSAGRTEPDGEAVGEL